MGWNRGMMYTHNPDRKSVGLCKRNSTKGKVRYSIEYTKWKFKAPDKAEEVITYLYFHDYESFRVHYEKFKCSLDTYTSRWGRYGDAVFPVKVEKI